MYVAPLKTLLLEALKLTFDTSYPVAEFREVHIGLNYPVDEQDYPSYWVDYDDTQPLLKAGIGHLEYVDPNDDETPVAPYTRWRFQGYVSVTSVAMTSLECDRLFDELVRVVAFSNEDGIVGRFKNTIASNDLIAATLNTDKIEPRGSQAAPGTPWGTDEIMYERTLNLELIGEFVPDPATGTLINLSRIIPIVNQELPSQLTYVPDNNQVLLTDEGLTHWH